jgi:hypothetical protein
VVVNRIPVVQQKGRQYCIAHIFGVIDKDSISIFTYETADGLRTCLVGEQFGEENAATILQNSVT